MQVTRYFGRITRRFCDNTTRLFIDTLSWLKQDGIGDTLIIVFATLGGVALITGAVFLTLHIVKKLKNRPPKQRVQNNSNSIMTGVKTQFDDETAFISFCNADNNTQVWKAYLNEPVLMGRDEHCIIQLESTTVSREHCLIIYQHGNVEIENKSKTSIAKLNDRPLDRRSILKEGDRIKCGGMTLFVSEIFLPKASKGSLKETSIFDV